VRQPYKAYAVQQRFWGSRSGRRTWSCHAHAMFMPSLGVLEVPRRPRRVAPRTPLVVPLDIETISLLLQEVFALLLGVAVLRPPDGQPLSVKCEVVTVIGFGTIRIVTQVIEFFHKLAPCTKFRFPFFRLKQQRLMAYPIFFHLENYSFVVNLVVEGGFGQRRNLGV